MKGRTVPTQTKLRATTPKRAALPGCDLTLSDGRLLHYLGQGERQPVGGGKYLRMAGWKGDDGMTVVASMDNTQHGRLLHVALSYPDHYPTWEDIKAVRYAFYPRDVDVAMMLPQDGDYINIHEFCMQMWQTPVEWGLW